MFLFCSVLADTHKTKWSDSIFQKLNLLVIFKLIMIIGGYLSLLKYFPRLQSNLWFWYGTWNGSATVEWRLWRWSASNFPCNVLIEDWWIRSSETITMRDIHQQSRLTFLFLFLSLSLFSLFLFYFYFFSFFPLLPWKSFSRSVWLSF